MGSHFFRILSCTIPRRRTRAGCRRSILLVYCLSLLRIYLWLGGVLCALSPITQAAQVTFAFDASVVEVTRSANGTFDLPFTVSPGDSLNGILQFEAILFGQSGDATKLQLNLASALFSADDVPLNTFDNYVVPFSSSAGGIYDGINAGCSTPSSCAGATSSLDGITIDSISLGLASGDIQSFNVGENLADSTFWNRFDLFPSGGIFGHGATRSFILELSSAADETAGTVFIRGHLGSMIAVPEPASAHAAVTFVLSIVFLRRRLRGCLKDSLSKSTH